MTTTAPPQAATALQRWFDDFAALVESPTSGRKSPR